MHDRGFEARREFFDLAGPIGEQRSGRDNEARTRRRVGAVALRKQQQRQDLDGLAEAHVVGEAGPKPETADEPQPGDAGLLIGPQRALQRRAWISAAALGARKACNVSASQGPAAISAQAARASSASSCVTVAPASIRIASAKLTPSRAARDSAPENCVIACSRTGAIDLDPLAAQERQSVGSGERERGLPPPSAFAMERRCDLEIEPPGRPRAEGSRRPMVAVALGAAAARCARPAHPQNHAGVSRSGADRMSASASCGPHRKGWKMSPASTISFSQSHLSAAR